MKKKIWLLLGIVIIILSLGIAGKFFMDKKEEQKQEELLAVERQSVKVLKNTFADIAEVKIEKSVRNDMTGFYSIVVTMFNTNGESVFFDYGFVKNSNELSDYGVIDRRLQEKGKTENQIRVIYSNGEEETI